MGKHTNLKINDQRESGWMNNAIYISSPTGFNLARVYDDANDAEDTAALIVRAVNTHEALIAALQFFVNGVETGAITSDHDETLAHAMKQARVALEGGKNG